MIKSLIAKFDKWLDKKVEQEKILRAPIIAACNHKFIYYDRFYRTVCCCQCRAQLEPVNGYKVIQK
jgi:hypothetical protein